jgi:hypothetical protein
MHNTKLLRSLSKRILNTTVKESLPALVRDLFTFSSKVIKGFVIVYIKKKFECTKQKRKESKKAKIRAPTGYDPWTSGSKIPSPNRLSYEGLAVND